MMKDKLVYMLFCGMALLLASCSDSEDVQPSHADVNNFAPADDDMSEEAQLRRDFFNETGCYLLFNDTLSVKEAGKDIYGNINYDVETVNMDYNLQGSGTYFTYKYEYLADIDQKRKAAAILEKVLKKLPGTHPFSIMLADSVTQMKKDDYGVLQPTTVDEEYGENPYPIVHQGFRCTSVSMRQGQGFEDPNYDRFLLAYFLKNLIVSKISGDNDDFLADFKAPVENYNKMTSGWWYKDDFDYDEGIDDDLARSLGFIKDLYEEKFPTKYDDIFDYVKATLDYSVPEFEEAFAEYPICITRFNVMRGMLEKLGYKFDN